MTTRDTYKSTTNLVDRTNLSSSLTTIWGSFFPDVPQVNEVRIEYGECWKCRLGLICLSQDSETSRIRINRLLQVLEVPDAVLITTIAHELVHYSHGFGSPLPRPYADPHANRVVEQELEKRHLGGTLQRCDQWITQQWYCFYEQQYAACRSRRASSRR